LSGLANSGTKNALEFMETPDPALSYLIFTALNRHLKTSQLSFFIIFLLKTQNSKGYSTIATQFQVSFSSCISFFPLQRENKTLFFMCYHKVLTLSGEKQVLESMKQECLFLRHFNESNLQ